MGGDCFTLKFMCKSVHQYKKNQALYKAIYRHTNQSAGDCTSFEDPKERTDLVTIERCGKKSICY